MSRQKKQPSEILDRLPPTDKAAEMAVIGSLMLDPKKRDSVGQIVQATDFSMPGCRLFFSGLMALDSLDSILLLDSIRVSGRLDEAGGPAFLAECIASVAVAAHAEHYAHIVAEMSRKRAMIHLNLEALKATYSGRWKAKDLAEKQIKRLKEIQGREK